MAAFTKLSLRRMTIMPIITLGLYFWAWLLDTRSELNEAGGKIIPSFWLSFVAVRVWPLRSEFRFLQQSPVDIYLVCLFGGLVILSVAAPCYFWFKYVQAYVKIVKKSSAREDFVYYFAIALLPHIISSSLVFMWLLLLIPRSANLIYDFLLAWSTLPIILGGQFKAGIFEWSIFAGICVLIYLLNLGRMLIFQKGFNEYKE